MKTKLTAFAITAALVAQMSLSGAESITSKVEIKLASEVEWTYLNPARAELAPMAGTLWGDREGTEPTGFLLKPPQNFASPPHIHNISYRGVVISGVVHNDDPNAAEMWMPAGSFWTQPKGEVHITAAEAGDSNSLAYIEIEEGPYLVQPADGAFDSGERPVNVNAHNLVWLNASDVNWIEQSSTSPAVDGPQVAFLWGHTGEGQLNGSFIKLPAGFSGTIHNQGDSFRAIVVKGQPKYLGSETQTLTPGSLFSASGAGLHHISSKGESVFYIRTDGKYEVLPTE